MRLTQYTDYSLRVLTYLALAGEERSTIRSVSAAYGISRSHVMKVVQQLAQLGYVTAVRGQGGGLRLGQPADQIRLGDVVRNMEPDFAMVECYRTGRTCAIETACALPSILDEAVDAYLGELNKHTLADLIPRAQTHKLIRLLNL